VIKAKIPIVANKIYKSSVLGSRELILSNVPLRVWSFIGFSISLISFVYAVWIIVDTLLFGVDLPGYATIVVAIMFFGGVQLLSIGILGEYIARIFNEVKQRPTYIIESKIGFDE